MSVYNEDNKFRELCIREGGLYLYRFLNHARADRVGRAE